MEFYKFKSEAMYTSFRDSCRSNRKIAEDITQNDLLPWYTVFDLTKVHDACYVNGQCTTGLYFHPSEVNQYLEKVTRQTLEKEEPVSEEETNKIEIETKYQVKYKININGLFTEDEVRKLIVSLEEKL